MEQHGAWMHKGGQGHTRGTRAARDAQGRPGSVDKSSGLDQTWPGLVLVQGPVRTRGSWAGIETPIARFDPFSRQFHSRAQTACMMS